MVSKAEEEEDPVVQEHVGLEDKVKQHAEPEGGTTPRMKIIAWTTAGAEQRCKAAAVNGATAEMMRRDTRRLDVPSRLLRELQHYHHHI